MKMICVLKNDREIVYVMVVFGFIIGKLDSVKSLGLKKESKWF